MKRRIGEALKNIRLTQQLDQSELAEALGVSQPMISKIESGKVGASAIQLVLWADACKVEFLFLCLMVKTRLDDKK